MALILGLLVAGYTIGYVLLRLCSIQLPDAGKAMSMMVLLMLFSFGMSIGCDRDVMMDINKLGLMGLCFGLTSLFGSACVCMLLQRMHFKKSVHSRSCRSTNRITLKTIMGSLATLASFATGIIADYLSMAHVSATQINAVSEGLLYLLIFTVALGLGNKHALPQVMAKRNAMYVLIPLFSVAGTAMAGIVLGMFPTGFSLGECIAGVSGMGYYSLSSVMITNLKAPDMGIMSAMQLGAVALVGNMVRELASLMLAPVIYSRMGTFALIGASGVTSMDVCLPTITAVCGDEAVAPSLVNGIVLEVSMAFIVTAACAIP